MAKNLSIRKVPPELERAIQQEAIKRKVTKTEVVLKALSEVFHLSKAPNRIRRNVRKFFGHMTLQEYKEFQSGTLDFSKIDSEIWK